MKAMSLALALVCAVAFSGCANLRARSAAPKPAISNPCAVPACAAVKRTIEK